VPDQPLEESTILDLEETSLGLVETPTTDFLAPFIVPIQFYERQIVLHTAMETNVVTPSGNSSIPTTVVTTGEISPPNPPSSVRATMVSTASTSHSAPIPSLATTTTSFTPSATSPSFSYEMPSSGTSPILSYSTLHNLGLGVGSSSTPLQGHMGGTPTPFKDFPYRGGHIPPSSPSLGGSHQPSARQPTHNSLFGVGSQGPPSHSMPVGSTPFSWKKTFGNNTFSSVAFPTGGNPIFGQSTPMQGTILAQGENLGTSFATGPWNSGQGSVPSSGLPIWGNSFHNQWNPRQTTMPIPTGPAWGNPSQSPSNIMHAQQSMSYLGNQPMMSPHMQNPYAGQGHGFYQNPGQQPNFSWQPGASQTPGPFLPGYHQQPKLPFLATFPLPYLTWLLNDPIFHDLCWPPMPMKLPLNIPKFEAKPNKDPGDHVTTFHLWCSYNSLKYDSVQL
jgi:hypothetical protein